MWWSRESKLAELILMMIGIGFCLGGIIIFQTSKGVVDVAFGYLIMVGCGVVGGLILSPMISKVVGGFLGDSIYFKREKIARAPERLDRMRGLVKEGKYEEAASELKIALARDFMDIEARMLLMRVYQETLHDLGRTTEVCREYFDHPGHISNGTSVEMLLHFSDLLAPEDAVKYLKKELKRGKYAAYDKELIRKRMEALS